MARPAQAPHPATLPPVERAVQRAQPPAAARPAAPPAPAAIVQPKYAFAGNKDVGQAVQKLLVVGQDDSYERKLEKAEIERGLRLLQNEAYRLGEIDLDNEQHLILLYGKLLKMARRWSGSRGEQQRERKRQHAWEYRQRKKLRDRKAKVQSGNYRIAILGAGSSAAYYLSTMDPTYDHFDTLLVGQADPWAGRRGTVAIDFINHTPLQIQHYGKSVPKPVETFGTGTEIFVKREAFAAASKRIIESLIPRENRVYAEEIRAVTRNKQTGVFTISAGNKTYKARKVIVCTGAGPHKRPGPGEGVTITDLDDRAIDMDQFIASIVTDESKKTTGAIVLQGPNAGIDAVAAAKDYGWKISWFINRSEPQWLPGTKYDLKHLPRAKVKNVRVTKGDDEPVKVVYDITDGATDQELSVDYYVYAIGQDINAKGSAGKFLSDEIKNSLEMVVDQSRRFEPVVILQAEKESDVGPAPITPGKKILGLRLKGTQEHQGLVVIGAAADALAKDRRLAAAKDIDAIHEVLPSDVVGFAQLGAIRSTTSALNEHIPAHVARGEVDFSSDDVTTLRAFIALSYPHIDNVDSEHIINSILAHRRTGHHPYGYDAWWNDHWIGVLEWWEQHGKEKNG